MSEEQIRIRRGEHPTIFPMDFSRLKLYLNCPAAFKFQYNDHLPRTTGDAASLGIAAHNFLEIYVNHGLEAAKLYVSAILPMTKRSELKRIQETIANIDFLGKPYSTEKSYHFYAEIGGKTVQFEARIDILYVHADRAEIIDGKTGRQLSSDVSDDPQGLFYALACLRSAELEPFDFQNIIFTQAQFQIGKLVSANFTREDIESYERYLHSVTEKIIGATKNNSFKPQPGPHCHWCPYVVSHCPVGRELAPEFYNLASQPTKVRIASAAEAKKVAEATMYLDAFLAKLKKTLRGYMALNDDAPIITDGGRIEIEVVKTKNFIGGITGIVERHPEEEILEGHYPRVKITRKDDK